MPQLSPLLDHYLAEFARVERNLPGADQTELQSDRKAALTRFIKAGFPTTRDEQWKYSDTRLLQKQAFELAAPSALSEQQLAGLIPDDLDADRLIFINGQWNPEISRYGDQLAHCIHDGPAASLEIEASHALNDMNQAFAAGGVNLQIPADMQLDRPVHLLFIAAPTDSDQMLQIRNRVQLGKSASATVIEHYVSLDEQSSYFNNCVTEIELAENAALTRIRLQTESARAMQVGASLARLKRDSSLTLHSIDLGGRWLRYDSNVHLTETGASIKMNGLYVAAGRQHMDNHTCVEHEAPHCTSREDYKGILDGGSRGVFNGRIVVHKNAQKTDSEQSSAALLLSAKAEVDAKPELEIYADDVKCKHGATVGQLDESAIFYLQSRGLDRTEARNLLTYSFADELIQRIGIEALQKRIEAAVLAKLPHSAELEELL